MANSIWTIWSICRQCQWHNETWPKLKRMIHVIWGHRQSCHNAKRMLTTKLTEWYFLHKFSNKSLVFFFNLKFSKLITLTRLYYLAFTWSFSFWCLANLDQAVSLQAVNLVQAERLNMKVSRSDSKSTLQSLSSMPPNLKWHVKTHYDKPEVSY